MLLGAWILLRTCFHPASHLWCPSFAFCTLTASASATRAHCRGSPASPSCSSLREVLHSRISTRWRPSHLPCGGLGYANATASNSFRCCLPAYPLAISGCESFTSMDVSHVEGLTVLSVSDRRLFSTLSPDGTQRCPRCIILRQCPALGDLNLSTCSTLEELTVDRRGSVVAIRFPSTPVNLTTISLSQYLIANL